MTRAELKEWAKKKIKGKVLFLFGVIIVGSIIANISIPYGKPEIVDGQFQMNTISLALFLGFITVGLTKFLVSFINDKECSFNDLFAYAKDFFRIFVVNLLKAIFIFLWSLLLVIPGIIKAFAYSLVDMILADEKYADLGFQEVLDLSQDMMNGHKMDAFVLGLSFIGWHLLAMCTLFILEIWVLPYQEVTVTKFLYDIKTDYEKKNK